MVTIHDIAKHLGINAGTVSRALRNLPGVGEELRQKIESTAKEMGYQPNIIASQLRSQSSSVIGLIIEERWDWLSGAIADGVQSCAKENNYSVLVWNALSEEDQKEGLRLFERMRLAGVIIADTHMKSIKNLAGSSLPTIYINHIGEPGTTSILWDDEYGTALAILHLLALGHSKIGFINGPGNERHSNDRYNGVLKGMHAAGMSLPNEYYGTTDWTSTGGYEQALKILAQGNRPTAIFCGNDEIAVGVYDAANELGLKIPEDVSVVGYDNNSCATYMRPPLTTISLPLWQMGVNAVEEILNRTKNPKNIASQLLIKGNLIVRKSTAPPNKER